MKKSIYTFLGALVVVTLLAACKISKDLEVPKEAVPVSYRNADSGDTSSIADLPWKSFFTEPALVNLIDSALKNNNNMLIALKNIEAAQLQWKQSKWGYVPELNLQIAANSTNPSNNSLNGKTANLFLGQSHIEDFNAQIGLSWEADIWGKIRNQKRSALAQYLQTEEAVKMLQTAIVSGVSKGYYNLLMLDAQMDIAQRNLQLSDSTLFVINFQYEAGQVTSLAQQQAEAQRLNAARLIPQLEQEIAIQENALSTLTGSFPEAKQRGTGLSAIALPENLPVGIPSSLVSRRPDVKSAELSLDVANAQVGISKAGMYPSLNITAAGGLSSFLANNWFKMPASLFGTVAGGLTQPLLQRKKLRTHYEVSKIEREKVVIQFRQSVLVAVQEVSDALVKVEKLREQQRIVENRVNILQTAVSNSDMLFKSGVATYLEVITAQSGLLQSELELANLKRAQLEASVELYRSLGGGWK